MTNPALTEKHPPAHGSRRRTQILRTAGALLLMLAIVWIVFQGYRWSEERTYLSLEESGRDRLTLYGATIHVELEKSRNVPVVLASDAEIVSILSDPSGPEHNPEKVQALNQRLQSMNGILAVDSVYVLDRNGIVIASGNWSRGTGSFVGQRLRFRSYFGAAMTGLEGRELAIGTTAGQFGYYIAMPVKTGDEIVGAVAVKMIMESLEHGWAGGGEKVIVSDANGVIFITNQPEWRFRTVSPLDKATIEKLRTTRQYEGQSLEPLKITRRGDVSTIDDSDYIMVSQALPDGDGWTLHILLDVAEAQGRARDRAYLALALITVALLLGSLALTRARLLHRHARELEHHVAERTVELVASNERLQDEIAERMRAERELKDQQDALIQSAKLAALGQMSAGLSHEINQPLGAIRAYADNAVKLLAMGRNDTVRDNLLEIAGLTERIARLSGELKLFARKSDGALDRVQVADVIERALSLLTGRIDKMGGTIQWTNQDGNVLVWGNALRIEQVMVNLLRNALDAVEKRPDPWIGIRIVEADSFVSIIVADNGHGIPDSVMAQLFDPFFTTKPAEQGLGLGLSISDGIIRSLGGQITAANRPDGGAEFTVTLRSAKEPS